MEVTLATIESLTTSEKLFFDGWRCATFKMAVQNVAKHSNQCPQTYKYCALYHPHLAPHARGINLPHSQRKWVKAETLLLARWCALI